MLEWLETRFLPTVYTVNTVNDILGDTTPGELTLRDAITAINTQAPSGNAPAGTASNTIKFAIGPVGSAQTIDIGSGNTATPLPALTQQVFIDGQSQSGSGPVSAVPLITLDGTSAGAGADGLTFHPGSNSSEVSGLDIVDFSNTGIAINGASDVLITANHLNNNTSNGLLIAGSAAHNSIGSGLSTGGNVISGNGINGIDITGVAATDNVIWGNLIGTNAAGTSAAGNGSDGILILGKASGNSIGGTSAASATSSPAAATASRSLSAAPPATSSSATTSAPTSPAPSSWETLPTASSSTAPLPPIPSAAPLPARPTSSPAMPQAASKFRRSQQPGHR